MDLPGQKRGSGRLYKCQASPLEVEQEYYFLFADHGSDYHGMYQQWMANLMTPLRDRRRICAQVIDNYTEAQATGTIADPDAPQPEVLKPAERLPERSTGRERLHDAEPGPA